METSLCPDNSYCGVSSYDVTDILNCSACDWGFRPDAASVCRRCADPMPIYDWMFLGFMVLLSFILHWIAIDINTNRKSRSMLLLYVSALLENLTAAICSLLLMAPVGSLSLYSCGVKTIRDWYSLFYNPVVEYKTMLHCTQEMVYPLYTIVMIFYSLQIPAMLIFRPILSNRRFIKEGVEIGRPIYYALYFLPLLVLLQATAGGILYYGFPYISLLVSNISLIVHMTDFEDQGCFELFKQSMFSWRSLPIILLHWLFHAYGILSLNGVASDPTLAGCLMLLVPVPYALYILSSRFTNPENID